MSGASPPRPGFSLPIQEVHAAGLTAWLVEDHAIPVAALSWSWRGGAALDAAGAEGTASMAAALLTEGAGPLSATAFADALRDQAIGLNFGADRDSFEGGFRALSDALPDAVRLGRLAMAEPRFDPEAVERVRARAIAAATRSLETPRGQAGRAFWASAYPGHPASRQSGGTPESLAGIGILALRAALDRQIHRDGLLVAAAGAITPARLAEAMEELFGGLPAGAPPVLPPLPPFRDFGRIVLPVASPQSSVVFGQDGLAAADPDWEAAQVALRILAGGGFTSRLMQAVREQRGLAYGIGAGLSVLFRHGVILGTVATENARVAETLAVTREEWARMAATGATEAELADAVAFLTGSLPLQFADTRRTAEGLLAMRQNGRPIGWLADRPERLRALTTTRIAAVSARLLRPETLAAVVAGEPVGL
ncbi:MAG: insulinase family protein [Acetobacteraceae bacterium]|nr:insulinase family protein [Acetobacteraceae bacterium]